MEQSRNMSGEESNNNNQSERTLTPEQEQQFKAHLDIQNDRRELEDERLRMEGERLQIAEEQLRLDEERRWGNNARVELFMDDDDRPMRDYVMPRITQMLQASFLRGLLETMT